MPTPPALKARALLSLGLVAALVAGVATVTFATTSGAAPANLVKNPGLEVDANRDGRPDGWSAVGYGVNTSRFTRVGQAHSGSYAQKVTVDRHTSGDRKLLAAYDTGGIPVSAGRSYDLSTWYRTDATVQPVVFRRDGSGTWSYWTGANVVPRSSGWNKTSLTTPPVPSGTVALSFGLAIRSTGWLITDDYTMSLASGGGVTTTTKAPSSTSTTKAPATTSTTKAPTTTTTKVPAPTTTTTKAPAPTTTTTTTAPPAAGGALVEDHFDRPDGLISNEYAFWSPSSSSARHDAVWQLNSGSLFAKGGVGFTGVPDDREPNAASSNGTDSAILRLLTNQADLTNFEVSFKLRHEGFVTTSSTPAVAWDGVHVFLRYADEENLYYASVNRRDGTTQIKKKVSGGPSNGGTYYTLADGKNPFTIGAWQSVRATIEDQSDGSVAISLFADGRLVARAVDKGTGGPVIRSGQSGIRGDNSQFSFDDFVVRGL